MPYITAFLVLMLISVLYLFGRFAERASRIIRGVHYLNSWPGFAGSTPRYSRDKNGALRTYAKVALPGEAFWVVDCEPLRIADIDWVAWKPGEYARTARPGAVNVVYVGTIHSDTRSPKHPFQAGDRVLFVPTYKPGEEPAHWRRETE